MIYFERLTSVLCLTCYLASCGTIDANYSTSITSQRPSDGQNNYARKVNNTKPYAYYRIKHGDTLYSIAWKNGQDYATLAQYNSLAPPYTIYPGQFLIIPRNFHASKSTVAVQQSKSTNTVKAVETTNPLTVYAKPSRSSWQWPVRGELLEQYAEHKHKGIKIHTVPGETVKAAAAGKVVYSGNGIRAYGNLIIIKHNERHLSAYGFNRKLLVQDGDEVKLGQAIALLGKPAILHFEVRHDGDPIDPLSLLPKQ